jgi:hypothetical protein
MDRESLQAEQQHQMPKLEHRGQATKPMTAKMLLLFQKIQLKLSSFITTNNDDFASFSDA